MADSGMSASELRQRYHRGGSANDDELSAAQLRARHGIPSNKGNVSSLTSSSMILLLCYLLEKFSTGDGKGKKGIDTTMIIGGVIGIY